MEILLIIILLIFVYKYIRILILYFNFIEMKIGYIKSYSQQNNILSERIREIVEHALFLRAYLTISIQSAWDTQCKHVYKILASSNKLVYQVTHGDRR